MAQRNTYREDESQEERINIHELMRIRKYVKPIAWPSAFPRRIEGTESIEVCFQRSIILRLR